FQAEDGIRDKLVTGVQTCALPISPAPAAGEAGRSKATQQSPEALQYGAKSAPAPPGAGSQGAAAPTAPKVMADAGRTEVPPAARSEERRVGKEGRSRGAWGH